MWVMGMAVARWRWVLVRSVPGSEGREAACRSRSHVTRYCCSLLAGFEFGWLVGWLVGWVDWVGWLVGWLVG